MPTEQDRAKVIQPTWVEDCEWADGTTLEDVVKIARHTLEEVAGGEVQWLGNHDLAAKLWAETYYTNTGWFGEWPHIRRVCCWRRGYGHSRHWGLKGGPPCVELHMLAFRLLVAVTASPSCHAFTCH
jgi:hypothetical protein